jgi:drug/metabolite transporter superfamily protein YnfA
MKPRIEKKAVIKIIGINLTLALLLFGLIFINKTIFRPTFNISPFFQILTGSFPNFIAALLMSLCVVNPVLIKKPKFGRLIVYAISLGIMSILIFDELKSVVASKQYDIYDIIGSVMGSILAILTYEYLFYRQNLKLKRIEI